MRKDKKIEVLEETIGIINDIKSKNEFSERLHNVQVLEGEKLLKSNEDKLEMLTSKCLLANEILKDIIKILEDNKKGIEKSEEILENDALTESLYSMKQWKDGYAIEKYIGFDDEIINIPNTYKKIPVIEILDKAFSECNNIKKVILGKNIKLIGDEAFSYCGELEEVILNEGIIGIALRAFDECYLLRKLNLPNSIEFIDSYAFSSTAIENIKIPVKVRYISKGLFSYCTDLKRVILESKIVSISRDAFNGCEKMESINIPPSVSAIGSNVFQNCYMLREMEIADNVNLLGKDIFSKRCVYQPDRRYNPRIYYTNLNDVIIKCNAGSKIQQYARKNNIKCKKAQNLLLASVTNINLEEVIKISISKDLFNDEKLFSKEEINKIIKRVAELGYRILYCSGYLYLESPISKEEAEKIISMIKSLFDDEDIKLFSYTFYDELGLE